MNGYELIKELTQGIEEAKSMGFASFLEFNANATTEQKLTWSRKLTGVGRPPVRQKQLSNKAVPA